jgi:hypothetical protein
MTTTVDSVSTASVTLQATSTLLKRHSGPSVPKYAKKCGDYDCWKSACSCLGVKPATIRAATPTVYKTSTSKRTVTPTKTKSVVQTSTSQTVVTKGATVFKTTTVSTTIQVPTSVDQITMLSTTTTATVGSVLTTTITYCANPEPTFALVVSGGTNNGKYVTLNTAGQMQPLVSEAASGVRFFKSGNVVHTLDNDRNAALTSAVDSTFAINNFRSLSTIPGGYSASNCFLNGGNSGALSCSSGSANRSWWMECNPSPGCSISVAGIYQGTSPTGSEIPACGNCQQIFVFSSSLCVVSMAT